MEGDAPVLMATTPLAGILYLIKEDHAGSLAATTSPAMGAGGRSGFMAGMHGCRPCAGVPHGGGALAFGTNGGAVSPSGKAGKTVPPSLLTAIARGLSPKT